MKKKLFSSHYIDTSEHVYFASKLKLWTTRFQSGPMCIAQQWMVIYMYYSDLSNNRTGTAIYFPKKSFLYGLVRDLLLNFDFEGLKFFSIKFGRDFQEKIVEPEVIQKGRLRKFFHFVWYIYAKFEKSN